MVANIDQLLDAARDGRLVIFAGAGISMSAPTHLPGWNELQHQVAVALAGRLEHFTREGWLTEDVETLRQIRQANRFPPEYQAQVIEEMCGQRYFEGLQALDVTSSNACHRAIAALMKEGQASALVTTNFDRLVELSLEEGGAAYQAVIDETDFDAFAASDLLPGTPPIIKIHGCVSRADSMIDTLKQRKRGRRASVKHAIGRLEGFHWLFVGFSGNDLNSDRDYLGLLQLMSRSGGGTYLAWPGHPPSSSPELTAGAKMLIEAFPGVGGLVVGEATTFLPEICHLLGLEVANGPVHAVSGGTEFRGNLQHWADGLSDSAAALCLAAVFEAAGMGERAARVLHQLVDDIHPPGKDDPDWLNLQLHYARIGAANARFTNVPNLQGFESNASLESLQSLFRASASGGAFKYDVPMPAAWLWRGIGEYAIGWAASHLNSVYDYCKRCGYLPADPKKAKKSKRKSRRQDGNRTARPILTAEDAVDAWIYAAHVAVVMKPGDITSLAWGLGQHMVRCANDSGDPARAARVLGISALIAAEFSEDPNQVLVGQEAVLYEAKRVGEGFHVGIISLAFGRYRVGSAGIEQAQQGLISMQDNASQADELLAEAHRILSQYAYRGWATYALIHRMKALADLRAWKEVDEVIDAIWPTIQTIKILAPDFFVARGQLAFMVREFSVARAFYEEALQAARSSDFPPELIKTVEQYLQDPHLS